MRARARPGHLRDRALAQLEHIAEKNDPVGSLECPDQALEGAGAAREVMTADGAKVKVGHDSGLHPEHGASRA